MNLPLIRLNGELPYNNAMPIRVLSDLLVNQIAAGEVIERPASVVKELMENALDAGASRITVHVEDGGRELIRISDNGHGIAGDELPLALCAHATSKIAQAQDLEAIATLGFRGEALASIASVSRLRLTSRTPQADGGMQIEAAGDKISDPKPVSASPGTVVEVRNLFFNTPARRKFMRGAQTEMSHISDTVQRIAMAHPGVGFALHHNDRTMIDLPPNQPADLRCLSLLGKELQEALLEFESDERGIGLWGMAALPAMARATTKFQYVYINGRPVRDRHIGHAIKEAYRGLIEPAKQPMIVLFITMDPTRVDVNVHPAKAEVRFAESAPVHGQVLATIRQRLLGADLTPAATLPAAGSVFHFESSTAAAAASQDLPEPQVGNLDAFVNHFKQMDPKQKGFVYQQVKQALGVEDEAGEQPPQHPLTASIQPASQPILQVHNSYIVTEDETGLVIIDQHALHERMMFQTLLDRVEQGGKLESQRLLTPIATNCSARQLDTLQRLGPLLERIGIEADPIGPASIGINAFPSLLFDRGVDPESFLSELIDRAEADDFNPSQEAALHETLDMMSCKAAIKAGDTMSPDELSELLKRRDQIERASNCPHGRPTTVRLSLRELEKQFKRT